MTLNQLEYFCAVCRCHSITAAAESLFVTQPTISIAIRELENEFHLRLFTRQSNRLLLTREGEDFYRRADALLKESRSMAEAFAALGAKESALKIGIPPLISTLFFPRLTDLFAAENDQPVQLYEYGSAKARRLVMSEDLDLAMVNMDFYDLDQFNSLTLMDDIYTYCVSRTHPFAEKTSVSLEEIGRDKIILFNTDSVQNETIEERFRSLDLTPQVILHSSQLYTILNFVRGGSCGAFLFSGLPVNPRDFLQIPVSPEIPARFGLIWKKGVFIPARTLRFVDFARTAHLI